MTVVVNSFSMNWDELCKESCKIVGLEVILLRLEAVPNVYDMNSLQLEYLRCDVLLLLGNDCFSFYFFGSVLNSEVDAGHLYEPRCRILLHVYFSFETHNAQ